MIIFVGLAMVYMLFAVGLSEAELTFCICVLLWETSSHALLVLRPLLSATSVLRENASEVCVCGGGDCVRRAIKKMTQNFSLFVASLCQPDWSKLPGTVTMIADGFLLPVESHLCQVVILDCDCFIAHVT